MAIKLIAAVIATIFTLPAFCAESISTNSPVAAILEIPGMPASDQPYVGPQVVLACWADGRIIWSATNAGPPFKQGQYDKAKLTALIEKMNSKGVFTDTNLINYGPDAGYTCLSIAGGDHRLNLMSWHEHFEKNSKLVATDNSIRALSPGETRESVFEKQPQRYKNFVRTWSEIKTNLVSLIPSKGEPLDGDPSVKIWRDVDR
jgi:hypothetical protein